MTRENPCLFLLSGMLLFAWQGCDPPKTAGTVQVQGTVTIAGSPLPADAQGSINFMPTTVSQPGASSATISGGKYVAANVPKGKVLVSFSIMQPTGQEKAFAPGARPQMDMRSLVPATKANGQEIDVQEDNPNLNFDL